MARTGDLAQKLFDQDLAKSEDGDSLGSGRRVDVDSMQNFEVEYILLTEEEGV